MTEEINNTHLSILYSNSGHPAFFLFLTYTEFNTFCTPTFRHANLPVKHVCVWSEWERDSTGTHVNTLL